MIKHKDKKFFEKNGFFLFKNFFNKKVVLKARQWMLKQQPKKILKTWTETEPAVKIAVYSVLGESKTPVNSPANNKKMLKAASDLIGDEVYVWHSKINFKKLGWNCGVFSSG